MESPNISNSGVARTRTPAAFQTLPVEIRCTIWNYARSRCISIYIDVNGVMHTPSPSPITCHINRESRAETMKHYKTHDKLVFNCSTACPRCLTPYQFFDPAVDSVFLMNSISVKRRQGPPPYRPPRPIRLIEYMTDGYYLLEPEQTGQFNIIQSLHVATPSWNWKTINRQADVSIPTHRFTNLTEIIFEGGKEGLETEDDIKDCIKTMEPYYKTAKDEGFVSKDIRLPRIEIAMPGQLAWDMMFYGTSMNTISERYAVPIPEGPIDEKPGQAGSKFHAISPSYLERNDTIKTQVHVKAQRSIKRTLKLDFDCYFEAG
ncbi:hypothetical protein CJF32_00005414 [Rutstroemia sp. NJR-2017a WRK4]|nr:hypothetical protein CJF32_00005414 [Rutstroemia sp. NJR-2017a WRK4]